MCAAHTRRVLIVILRAGRRNHTSVELYCDGSHDRNPAARRGLHAIARDPRLQLLIVVSPLKSTGVVLSVANGTAPATSPQS